MRCLACDAPDTRVVDSRVVGDSVRRRRECQTCGERFTTHERVERRVPFIVKRDGRRELFMRDKVQRGIELACRKRPVSASDMEELVRRVESALEATREAEVPASRIGEVVLDVLRDVDEVAYVRFASVYGAFESVEQFIDVIAPLRLQREEEPA